MSKKKHSLHRVVAFLLALLLCLSGLPANGMTVYAEGETTYWTDYASGSLSGAGTAERPYLITSAQDLALLAVKCATIEGAQDFTTEKYFKIELPEGANNTIDLSEYYWTPIARFYGYLDGNGVSITGLKVGSNEENGAYTAAANVGLFGRIDSGSVVENLSVDVAIYTSSTADGHYVGGIAGISNGGTIDSCTVSGSITGAGSTSRVCVGGMVGRVQGNAVITNCINKAAVSASGNSILTFAAGIAANENGGVKIINSCNFGKITATVTGTTAKNAFAGGIVVLTKADSDKYVLNCYNAGIVSALSNGASAFAGEIAGQAREKTTMNYLYWLENTENTWYGNNSGATITGFDATAKTEAELKALADTLNNNVTAIKDDYTPLSSLTLKNWSAEEGQYPLPVGAVQIGNVKYATLADAVEAANAATTSVKIDLLASVISSGDITVGEKVTLDLNGCTLDMEENSCFLTSLGDIVDNSTDKTGRLKIDTYTKDEVAEGKELSIGTPKAKLAEDNSQMPVYIAREGAYMLATMKEQANVSAIPDDKSSFSYISRPSFGAAHVEKLQSGASAAGLQFILRLDWGTVTDGVYENNLEFSYSDELVGKIFTNGTVFSVTVNGLANYASSMKVSEYVISDLGVKFENNSFYMSGTK